VRVVFQFYHISKYCYPPLGKETQFNPVEFIFADIHKEQGGELRIHYLDEGPADRERVNNLLAGIGCENLLSAGDQESSSSLQPLDNALA
jgi:hypothetical protein